ncbi:MAG: hypothetical protein ACI87C_001287 [Paraperlucidibaca sp.]|jgi:hypothetical protein
MQNSGLTLACQGMVKVQLVFICEKAGQDGKATNWRNWR